MDYYKAEEKAFKEFMSTEEGNLKVLASKLEASLELFEHAYNDMGAKFSICGFLGNFGDVNTGVGDSLSPAQEQKLIEDYDTELTELMHILTELDDIYTSHGYDFDVCDWIDDWL